MEFVRQWGRANMSGSVRVCMSMGVSSSSSSLRSVLRRLDCNDAREGMLQLDENSGSGSFLEGPAQTSR
eukprot:4266259-Amphidinium_carterae.1